MALSYPTIEKKKTYAAPTTPVNGSDNTLASMASTTNPYEYNPGSNADQSGANIQPQSYVNGQVQNRNSLSTLNENLANSYQNTLASMLSGEAYSPYKTTQFQGMNKAAQQLRANAQQANVGRAGQGTAIANKNATEAGIAQMAGETALSALQGEQEMKERGLSATNTLAGMNETVRSNDISQGMATDAAYGYIDPVTGKRIRGSNELAGQQVDIQKQVADTQKELGYAQITSSEKISQNQISESARQFNIKNETDKQQFAATLAKDYASLSQQEKQFLLSFGLDEQRFNQAKYEYTQNMNLEYEKLFSNERITQKQLDEAARQFNVTNETDKSQFAETMKLNYNQLSQQQKQFLMNYGLDEQKFNQAKSEYTQNLNLEYKKLASQEKIATEQLGLDAKKLAESARQFNVSTAEAASQFTQKLNFDYASLSQQDKQFLSTLGLDQAKFEESKRQYNLTTSLEDKYRTKDLDIRERQLAQESLQFNSRLEFDRWATQAGLDDAAASRIWQANQNDKALENAKYIATMQNNTEVWKQNQVSELTRAGWAVEDARALADRQQQVTMFNLESALTREIESGRINQADRQLIEQARQFNSQQKWLEKAKQMDISEADAQRIWATNERIGAEAATKWQTTYEGQIQMAAMKQQLNIADKQLLEQSRQFNKKDEFDRWAVEQNLNEADKNRLWETNERIADNIHQLNMQSLQNAFTEKGWNTEILTSILQNQQMPEELAQAYLQDMAEAAGITHTEIVNGKEVEIPGFENFSQKAYNANSSLNANLDVGAIPTSGLSADEVRNMASGWDTYVQKYPNLFVSADKSLESFSTVSWSKDSKSWKISEEGNTWLNNNVGKLVKGGDGNVYKVVGKAGVVDKNQTSYIVLQDVKTGNTVRYSKGAGNSASYNYTSIS